MHSTKRLLIALAILIAIVVVLLASVMLYQNSFGPIKSTFFWIRILTGFSIYFMLSCVIIIDLFGRYRKWRQWRKEMKIKISDDKNWKQSPPGMYLNTILVT